MIAEGDLSVRCLSVEHFVTVKMLSGRGVTEEVSMGQIDRQLGALARRYGARNITSHVYDDAQAAQVVADCGPGGRPL